MIKRFIKKVELPKSAKKSTTIVDYINQFAEESRLLITQFNIIDDSCAYVLFEENLDTAHIVAKIVSDGKNGGFKRVYHCSNCKHKVKPEDQWCPECNFKLEIKPSI